MSINFIDLVEKKNWSKFLVRSKCLILAILYFLLFSMKLRKKGLSDEGKNHSFFFACNFCIFNQQEQQQWFTELVDTLFKVSLVRLHKDQMKIIAVFKAS